MAGEENVNRKTVYCLTIVHLTRSLQPLQVFRNIINVSRSSRPIISTLELKWIYCCSTSFQAFSASLIISCFPLKKFAVVAWKGFRRSSRGSHKNHKKFLTRRFSQRWRNNGEPFNKSEWNFSTNPSDEDGKKSLIDFCETHRKRLISMFRLFLFVSLPSHVGSKGLEGREKGVKSPGNGLAFRNEVIYAN